MELTSTPKWPMHQRRHSMTEVFIRRATEADAPAIMALLAASMHRNPAQPYDALFQWKHQENPFGVSPSWVAVDGERLAGFRTFLRWEFRCNNTLVRAVRAVDTATHPDYQGRGIFTRLTMSALDDLRADGVDLIFNTPNDKSRPGYLKMGWHEVGALATRTRITRPSATLRIARSRVPADIWSLASLCGVDPVDAFADESALDELLRSQPPSNRLSTNRSVAFLRWRYGFVPLHYRAVVGPGGLRDGVVVMRMRQRGKAVEAVIAEVIVPGDDPGAHRRLAARAASSGNGDYALTLGTGSVGRSWLPLPGGPILTARTLDGSGVPPMVGWDLRLGDIELF